MRKASDGRKQAWILGIGVGNRSAALFRPFLVEKGVRSGQIRLDSEMEALDLEGYDLEGFEEGLEAMESGATQMSQSIMLVR